MTIDVWLQAVVADAHRRGLPDLAALLESLARSTAALRRADFADRADVPPPPASGPGKE